MRAGHGREARSRGREQTALVTAVFVLFMVVDRLTLTCVSARGGGAVSHRDDDVVSGVQERRPRACRVGSPWPRRSLQLAGAPVRPRRSLRDADEKRKQTASWFFL